MLERRIEEAALNSWPSLQQMLLDGWLLRLADGYTKRANSVTPLYPAFLDMPEKIAFCEQMYEERDLPTIFRLLSFQPETRALERTLEQRGYQRVDLTHVLSTELAEYEQAQRDAALSPVSLSEWLPLFYRFHHSPIEEHMTHRELLNRIAGATLFATLTIAGEPVACGLGVLEHNLFGLFDIVTAPDHRNLGYGTRLVQGMLARGASRGAARAYLQVVGDNHVARRLYERLGFRELYTYWYRVQRAGG